jgi:hypothetical protein
MNLTVTVGIFKGRKFKWRSSSLIDRHESLYKYLRSKLDEAGIANLVSLITMTEEEYDQYDRVEVA